LGSALRFVLAKGIQQVRDKHEDFCFMAEVYWDLEWTMLEQGFDYAYDQRHYDRLREGHGRPVREHLYAGLDYQKKLVRFLENHDEPRAATMFAPRVHKAAAAVTFQSPGLRFFHQGELQGRKKRISPHIVRAPEEPVEEDLQHFYERLLAILRQPIMRDGQWQLLEVRTRLGGQLDLGLLPGLCLARSEGWVLPRDGELCSESEPMLRPATIRRSRGQ
jgi:hypothetical protein